MVQASASGGILHQHADRASIAWSQALEGFELQLEASQHLQNNASDVNEAHHVFAVAFTCCLVSSLAIILFLQALHNHTALFPLC